MNTDPDTMTPEQLRDALAVAAFGTTSVYFKDSDGGPGRRENPIPPLDSPEALGLIAWMMHRAYRVAVHEVHLDSGDVWQAVAHAFSGSHITAEGTTEAIARARLVLKVLAATKTAAV